MTVFDWMKSMKIHVNVNMYKNMSEGFRMFLSGVKEAWRKYIIYFQILDHSIHSSTTPWIYRIFAATRRGGGSQGKMEKEYLLSYNEQNIDKDNFIQKVYFRLRELLLETSQYNLKDFVGVIFKWPIIVACWKNYFLSKSLP